MATIQGFAQLKAGADYFHEMTEYYSKQYTAQARLDNPTISMRYPDDSEFMRQEEVQKSLDKDPLAPVWMGKMSAEFGIKDKIVMLDEFQNACNGYDPTAKELNEDTIKLADTAYKLDANGEPIAPKKRDDARRAGFEMMLTMSKEFSVLRTGSTPERQRELDQIFRDSVNEVVKEMEKLATVRRDGKEEHVDGLMVVPYFHHENRGDKDKQPQPHEHCHLVILNTCMKDGKIYALNSESIAKHKAHLNSVLMCKVVDKMRKAGYKMVPKYTTEDAKTDLISDSEKGVLTYVPVVDKDVVHLCNERKIGMDSNVAAAQMEVQETAIYDMNTSHKAREIAQQQTKNSKSKESIVEMSSRWRAMILDYKDGKYNQAYFDSIKDNSQVNLSAKDLVEGKKAIIDEKVAERLQKYKAGIYEKQGEALKKIELEMRQKPYYLLNPGKVKGAMEKVADKMAKSTINKLDRKAKEFYNEEVSKWDKHILDAFERASKKVGNSEGNIKNFVTAYYLQFTDSETAKKEATRLFEKEFVAGYDERAMMFLNKINGHKENIKEYQSNLKTLEESKKDSFVNKDGEVISKKGLMDRISENQVQIDSLQLQLDRNVSYLSKDFVRAEEQMVRDFQSVRNTKDFLLKESDVKAYINNTNKRLRDKAEKEYREKYNAEVKLQTPEYLNSLSPTAREEATIKLQTLKEKLNAGFKKEQEEFILEATLKPGGFLVVEGAAGAGKSFSSKAISDLYTSAGFNIHSIGSSQKNTENLAQSLEVSVEDSKNAAKFIADFKSGKVKLDKSDVLVCDEFSMLSGRDFHEFGKMAKETGCKMIFLGDGRQSVAINASQGYSILSKVFGSVKLREITRQEQAQQREWSLNFVKGKGDESLLGYAKAGKVDMSAGSLEGYTDKDGKEIKGAIDVAREKFIAEFQEFKKTNGKDPDFLQKALNNCMVVTGMNSTCDKINGSIREWLKEEKYLTGPTVSIKNSKESRTELMAGDKVMFLGRAEGGANIYIDKNGKVKNPSSIVKQNYKEHGFTKVSNGMEAEVLSVDPVKHKVKMKIEGKVVTIDSNQELNLSHATAAWTVNKAQGQTREKTICVVDSLSMMNANNQYVMYTRHKKDTTIVLHEGLKTNATKYGADVLDGPPTQEQLDRTKSIISDRGIKMQKKYADPDLWNFQEHQDFLEKFDKSYRKSNPESSILGYGDVLTAAATQAEKKTTFDYKIIDTITEKSKVFRDAICKKIEEATRKENLENGINTTDIKNLKHRQQPKTMRENMNKEEQVASDTNTDSSKNNFKKKENKKSLQQERKPIRSL